MEIECEKQFPSGQLVKQGAEARIFECNFLGRRAIIKERFTKKYRHPILDSKLTSKRLYGEARCMAKARKLGVATPTLFALDSELHTLTFEYIEGLSVKEVFFQSGSLTGYEEQIEDIAQQIGRAIGLLHDGGLVHGDLTTSNMIIHQDSKPLKIKLWIYMFWRERCCQCILLAGMLWKEYLLLTENHQSNGQLR